MLFAARSAASHFCRFLISLGSIKIFIQGAGEKVRESEKFYAVVERRGTERGGEGEEGAVLRVARVPLPIHLDISFTSERPERYEFDGRLSRMDSFSAIKKVGKKKKERKKGRNGGQRGREGGREEGRVDCGVRSKIRETWVHGSRNAEAPRTFFWSLLTGIWLPDVLRRSPLAHKSWNADRFIHRYRCT